MTPIMDVTDFQDLPIWAINISPEALLAHGEGFGSSQTPSTSIFIGGDHTDSVPATLNIMGSVVSRNIEADWIEFAYKLLDPWAIVGLLLVPLKFFPGHSLAIKVTSWASLAA